MEANELRIGNWVEHVKTDHYTLIECGKDIDTAIKLDCQPILLTEEWLLKFGAIKISDHNYGLELYRSGETFYAIKLIFHAGQWKWWLETYFQPRITYVHQLQNFYFTLTGNELTLK